MSVRLATVVIPGWSQTVPCRIYYVCIIDAISFSSNFLELYWHQHGHFQYFRPSASCLFSAALWQTTNYSSNRQVYSVQSLHITLGGLESILGFLKCCECKLSIFNYLNCKWRANTVLRDMRLLTLRMFLVLWVLSITISSASAYHWPVCLPINWHALLRLCSFLVSVVHMICRPVLVKVSGYNSFSSNHLTHRATDHQRPIAIFAQLLNKGTWNFGKYQNNTMIEIHKSKLGSFCSLYLV